MATPRNANVFVTRLDHCGHPIEAFRGRGPALHIADDRRADVRIDANDETPMLALGERGKCGADRLDGHRIGAEGQSLNVVRQHAGQVGKPKRTICRTFAVEGVVRLTVVGSRNDRDGGQPIGAHEKPVFDSFARESICEERAEVIARDATKEGRSNAKPR